MLLCEASCRYTYSFKNGFYISLVNILLVFAISTSIFLYDRILGSIMWILSVLTGLFRIWVGHHYPSDIIGSAFIASMTSIMLEKIFAVLIILMVN